ncbi:hypothetical protein AAY473_013118 [Plecturocebus cupreus]
MCGVLAQNEMLLRTYQSSKAGALNQKLLIDRPTSEVVCKIILGGLKQENHLNLEVEDSVLTTTRGRVRWLTLIIPALWVTEAGRSLKKDKAESYGHFPNSDFEYSHGQA